MKRYPIIALSLFLVIILVLPACNSKTTKEINARITIWRKDKIPYGAYYAFEQLPHLFPKAEIVIDKESPGNKNFFQRKDNQLVHKMASHSGRTAHFFLTPRMLPSSSEFRALLDFVYEGNQVFISSFYFGKEILDTLKLTTHYSYGFENDADSLRISITNPENNVEEFYSYPGLYYNSYFSSIDSGYTTVLGWNHQNKANFIKIGYNNGGAIYLHLAPLAFSNFFLLHKENNRYYDCALSNLPKGIELVVWQEYFRTHANGDDSGGSSSLSRAFNWIMKQPALSWAVWLLVLLFLLVYLFESKRRQKLIPVKKPLSNASLDFVKTIGRLYFQRKDNKNLVNKMTAHFLDHVRNRYNLSTSRTDEEFQKRLAYKTGIDYSVINNIVYQAQYLADQPEVTDVELMQFNHQLQNFYKHV